MVKLPNLTNFMLYSNDERVLQLNDGSRRYFFCNIKKTEEEIIQKTDEGIYDKAFEFADSDEGASALIYYFKNVDITDPKMFLRRAPQTDDLKELIEQSKHPVIKKLEYDLNRPDVIYRKVFGFSFCGLISFEELQDKLSTRKAMSDSYDWGSFGDDALYKFLASNCIKWNNGENTRQIEINGKRHRLYILEDQTPLFGKSYKDLAPKQIEIIFKNFDSIRKEIREQPDRLQKAKDEFPKSYEALKKNVVRKEYAKKNETVEDCIERIIKEGKAIQETTEKCLSDYRKNKGLIERGIKTPEEIIEEHKEEDFLHNPKQKPF